MLDKPPASNQSPQAGPQGVLVQIRAAPEHCQERNEIKPEAGRRVMIQALMLTRLFGALSLSTDGSLVSQERVVPRFAVRNVLPISRYGLFGAGAAGPWNLRLDPQNLGSSSPTQGAVAAS